MLLNFVDVAGTSQKTYKTLRKTVEELQRFFQPLPLMKEEHHCLHDLVSAAAMFFDASVFLIIGIVLSTVYDAFRGLARLQKSN